MHKVVDLVNNETSEDINVKTFRVFISKCLEAQKADKHKFTIGPLAFWRALLAQDQFHLLGKLALKILAVPATSACVERCFSKLGTFFASNVVV